MVNMESQEAIKRLVDLIPRLEGDDCVVEEIDAGIRLSFFDGQTFDVFEVGGWVQVGTILLSDVEMEELPYREEMNEFLLVLNSRCLGCRFALDTEGALLIVDDIPLDVLNEDMINESIDAIAFVDYVFYTLILETAKSGVAPTEEEIDQVLTEKEAAYENYH